MDYVTPKDKASELGLTQRRVEVLCDKRRFPGAYRLGRVWAIQKDGEKPIDGRTKGQGIHLGKVDEINFHDKDFIGRIKNISCRR